jgi:hypothetical protein
MSAEFRRDSQAYGEAEFQREFGDLYPDSELKIIKFEGFTVRVYLATPKPLARVGQDG